MYQSYLQKIESEIKSYGEALQPPVTLQNKQDLIDRVKSLWNITLPDGYLAFLDVVDGLTYDDLMIYASQSAVAEGQRGVIQGFLDTNLELKVDEDYKDYLVLGENSLSYYAYHIHEDAFYELEKGTLDDFETWPGFEEMLTDLLGQIVD